MKPRIEAIVIGASAGAIEALSAVLPALPADFSLPTAVVVHIPPNRPSAIVDVFRAKCRLRVTEAEDKEPLEKGVIYFAPPDYHLMVEPDRRISLSNEEPVQYSRPSIDVLLETAADAFGPALVAVVLTGAGSDGAKGLRCVTDRGGTGLVQDPETALVKDMPRAALQAAPSARALRLPEIAAALCELMTAE